jgi:hypothetical protein
MLGILIWLQGNILVWKYGLLDGEGIDWSKHVWRGLDALFWTVALILCFVFYNAIYKRSAVLSVALLSVQLLYFGFTSVQSPSIWTEGKKLSTPASVPQDIYTFSSNKNIIHIVFDAFQSDFFVELVNEDADYYRHKLEGFIFFKETIGAFATTYMSIPASLSGVEYKNNIGMRQFVKTILEGRTISNVLYDNGYEVDLVHIGPFYGKGRSTNSFLVPFFYGGSTRELKIGKSLLMMDIVLFRFAPHFLKKRIYNNQLWLLQPLVGRQRGLEFFQVSHNVFFKDLIENMNVGRTAPVYKFIHLVTTHPPVVIKKNCEYAGRVLASTRENQMAQYTCSLDLFIKLLDRLKSYGIYDSSLVIVQADTGLGTPVKVRVNAGSSFGQTRSDQAIVGKALPLLMIKAPYFKEPLRTSNVQAMLSDIPVTISSVLGLNEEFPGRSLFETECGEVRERKYHHYKWRHQHWQADFLPRLDEYIIRGSVFNGDSWRLGGVHLSPRVRDSFQAKRIDFGTENASKFLIRGWGGAESSPDEGYSYNWALGRSASVLLTLPKRAVKLTANVRPYVFENPVNITIRVDGKVIGIWKPSNHWKWQKHSLIIEADEHRPEVSILEFLFSRYRQPHEHDGRALAVLFESITLEEVKDQL